MNIFIFIGILIITLFIWVQPPKKKGEEKKEPFEPAPPIVREPNPLPLDPAHRWDPEPILSYALNAKVEECADCHVIRLISTRDNLQLPKNTKREHWMGEACNKLYKIDRHGGTFSSLQAMRKNWIATGHKDVPDPNCCCGYGGPKLNYYRDPRTDEKVHCPVHTNG